MKLTALVAHNQGTTALVVRTRPAAPARSQLVMAATARNANLVMSAMSKLVNLFLVSKAHTIMGLSRIVRSAP